MSEVREPQELERFLLAYNPKYGWDFRLEQLTGGGVYSVRPRKAFAWLDGQGEGFSGTATRFVFED